MIYLRRFRPFRLLLWLGLLLAPLAGCERPEDPVPPTPLLSKPQMVNLLTELHLLEARVDGSRLPPDSARALFQAQQRLVFERAGTTDSIFQRSYRYYGVHGKDLDELYKAVLDTLGRQERRLGGTWAEQEAREQRNGR